MARMRFCISVNVLTSSPHNLFIQILATVTVHIRGSSESL